NTVEIISGTERLVTSKDCLMEAYPVGAWGAMTNITLSGIHTYADSGVSDCCFVNREDFAEYTALDIPHEGQSANKEGIFKILGYGSVTKTIESHGLRTTITFKSALHTPDL
ncbi:hypothetical protein M422DRAFT_78314, partial [Sphaerobolus stellatus SS14]